MIDHTIEVKRLADIADKFRGLSNLQLCCSSLRHNPAYKEAYRYVTEQSVTGEEARKLALHWFLAEFYDPNCSDLDFEPEWVIQKELCIVTNNHLLSYAEEFNSQLDFGAKGDAYLHLRIDTRIPVSDNIDLIKIALKHELDAQRQNNSKLAKPKRKEAKIFPDQRP